MHKPIFVVDAPEFFNSVVLCSVAVFLANNVWLKSSYPGWLTGKLSDITFCFFFPLYVSALISLVSGMGMRERVRLGAIITALVFAAVKVSPVCSDVLNRLVSPVAMFVFDRSSINNVDVTDLVALPFVFVAMYFVQWHLVDRDVK